MAKRKLQQFAEVDTFRNVFTHMQYSDTMEDLHLKGKWHSYFKNDHPIVLELGCGKGEYTLGLAKAFPQKNFIGIDLKGNRIWRGAKTAIEDNMENIAFVRGHIENIETLFEKAEVDEIWITFPDPQPQKSREKKRLTAMPFLKKYMNVLRKGALIHLKTDSALLYEYTLGVIKEHGFALLDHTADLYGDSKERDPYLKGIRTYYEKKFSDKGFSICYLEFTVH